MAALGALLGLGSAMEQEHREQFEQANTARKSILTMLANDLENPNLTPEGRQDIVARIGALVQTKQDDFIHKNAAAKILKGYGQVARPREIHFNAPEQQGMQNVSVPSPVGAPGPGGAASNAPTAAAIPPPPELNAAEGTLPPATLAMTPPAPPGYAGPITETAVQPIMRTPQEVAAFQEQAERNRYAALYGEQNKAAMEREKLERADRAEFGTNVLHLEGDDLANFVINKTLRDTRSIPFQLVEGVIDNKPAYAWKDPAGVLREYTTAGPGKPLAPGVFLPKSTADEGTTFDKVNAAKQRIASGKPEPGDEQIVATWTEMHRPPQPSIIYIPGLGFVNKQTGQKTADVDVATTATRTMMEAAPKVISFIDRMLPEVDAQVSQLGPLAGRWSEIWAGKVGSPNKEFTKLRTDAGLLITMLMRMHVGARGGMQMLEHFRDLINVAGQSPENLRSALAEIRAYAKEVQGHGATITRPGESASPLGGAVPIVQRSKKTGAMRYSLDGGATWQSGTPPQ